ncbi:hypothetical protein EGW08_010858, partial [Elysia chlorotica]
CSGWILLVLILRASEAHFYSTIEKPYVKNHFGKRFVIFHIFTKSNTNCDVEVHVTTNLANGTLIDMRTPRLSVEEGGFRISQVATRDNGAKMCVPDLEESDSEGGKSNNVIILESEEEFAVIVSTHVSAIEEEIHTLYPMEGWGTVYYYQGHAKALLIVVAMENDTKLDISNCAHSHKDFQHFKNHARTTCPFHELWSLGKYEAFFEPDGTSGHLVMATKPVMVLTETGQIRHGVIGPKKLIYGFASTQFLPVEKWDRKFLFPIPTNPKIVDIFIQIAVEFSEAEKATLNKPIKSLYWRNGSVFPHRMTDIVNPRNTMIHELKFSPSDNVKFVKVCVAVRAQAVILFHTKHQGSSALGISNLPPVSHFDNIFMWSHVPKATWEYYFHIICADGEMKEISFTKNGSPLNLTVDQAMLHYEYSLVKLDGAGMYRFYSDSGYMMVFLEAFSTSAHSTTLSELGSRHTVVEANCTCHFEMRSEHDALHPCDDYTPEEADLDIESHLTNYEEGHKGVYEREEWSGWECDGLTQHKYKTRDCEDLILESADIECNKDREMDDTLPCTDDNNYCLNRKWGPLCEKDCPPNCDETECDRHTGTCDFGCKSGYYGPHCKDSCHYGYGGKDCATRCLNVCPSSDCDPVTLACKERLISKVTIGMSLGFILCFVVCPATGYGLYILQLKRMPPQRLRRVRRWRAMKKSIFGESLAEAVTEEVDEESDESSTLYSTVLSPVHIPSTPPVEPETAPGSPANTDVGSTGISVASTGKASTSTRRGSRPKLYAASGTTFSK